MKIEVYIPDHEIGVIGKVLELKEKRRLSSYVVDLLKKEDEGLTEDKVIALIKEYAETKNTSAMGGLESSIQSVLGSFDLKL